MYENLSYPSVYMSSMIPDYPFFLLRSLVSGLDHNPVGQTDEDIVGRVTVQRLLETLLVDELDLSATSRRRKVHNSRVR
jgi:hypothetical protein